MQIEGPRATRIDLATLSPRAVAELWVGGGWADFGDEVAHHHLQRALVVDCAGVLPADYRESARSWRELHFDDADAVPERYERIVSLAAESADLLTRGSYERVYVFCQYGSNRSNLVAGLILRHLGVAGEEAVHHLQRHRPGALGNDAFRRLVERFPDA